MAEMITAETDRSEGAARDPCIQPVLSLTTLAKVCLTSAKRGELGKGRNVRSLLIARRRATLSLRRTRTARLCPLLFRFTFSSVELRPRTAQSTSSCAPPRVPRSGAAVVARDPESDNEPSLFPDIRAVASVDEGAQAGWRDFELTSRVV